MPKHNSMLANVGVRNVAYGANVPMTPLTTTTANRLAPVGID